MALIPLSEYASRHQKSHVSVRQKAARGGFQTAQKIGRDWVIDEDEPYSDNRIITGKYTDFRKKDKD